MADLLTRLIRANDIIVRAYSYSDECSRLQRQANVTFCPGYNGCMPL